MEENKEITPCTGEPLDEATMPEQSLTPTEPEAIVDIPAESEEVAAAPKSDMPEDGEQPCACEEEASAQELEFEEEVRVLAAPWDFGANDEPKERLKGKGAFFGIFSAVLAICLALLILLTFLGGNGFHITKTIEILRTVYTKEGDGAGDLLSPQEAADLVGSSTVTVVVYVEKPTATGMRLEMGNGSGFVYDDKGHICTNHHVIEGAVRVQIVLPDGNALDAEIVGSDEESDLAVLRADPEKLKPATIGSSNGLLVGDSVVVVGTPYGMEMAGTTTFGKVSCVDRWIALDDNGDGTYEKKIRVIQTDTSVNPGNSGGPMADMNGRIVGVVVRKMTGNEGLGFAIPIDGAKTVLDAIIEKGFFTGDNPLAEGRSLVGVTGHGGRKDMWYAVDVESGEVSLSAVEKDGYHQMPADGVYVISVSGENAKGVLREGDVILAVNGFAVPETSYLIDAVNRYRVGQTVSLSIWRDGAVMTVELTLAEG